MANIEIIQGKDTYHKGVMADADYITILYTFDDEEDSTDYYTSGNLEGKVALTVVSEEEISSLEWEVTYSIEKYTTISSNISGYIIFALHNSEEEYMNLSVPYILYGDITPIWKDNEITVNEGAYNILVNEETVYTGCAKKSPSETNAIINLTPIVRSLMDKIKLNNLTTQQWNNNLEVMFARITDSDGITKGAVTYIYDYSYKDMDMHSNSYILKNEPINGHIMANQVTPFSILNLGSNVISLNGTSIGSPLANKVHTYISTSNNTDMVYSIAGTNLISYKNGYCGEGYLVYANRMGGYDSFLIEGGIKKTDTITQSNYMTKSNNTNNYSFANNRYVSDITTSYELTTGWLSDDESKRLAFHLLPSNEVYFYRFADAVFVPVVVNNASAQYQTFKTNDRKFCQYIINITESRDKLLR